MPQIITRNATTLQANWQKELADVITDPTQLLKLLSLNPTDFENDIKARKLFPMRVTRYFANLIESDNPSDPLLRQIFPSAEEFLEPEGFNFDPLGEQSSAVPGLLHKYPSRVLLIVRGGCATNCRYCFRRHFPYAENQRQGQGWQPTIDYIISQPQVNEVILSGGDPLMANDEQLENLIKQLETIPHLTRIRIHTRLLTVLPSRVTDELVRVLQETHLKVICVTHINHPNEVTELLKQSLASLRAAGVWLLNQTVLLKGVNDQPQTLLQLSEALMEANIQPYYIHLLDRVIGASHFEVTETEAIKLIHHLHANLPGFLVPRLVREIPNKRCKTPINLDM